MKAADSCTVGKGYLSSARGIGCRGWGTVGSSGKFVGSAAAAGGGGVIVGVAAGCIGIIVSVVLAAVAGACEAIVAGGSGAGVITC